MGVKGIRVLKHVRVMVCHVHRVLMFRRTCDHIAVKHAARIAQVISFIVIELTVHKLVEEGSVGLWASRARRDVHVRAVRLDALRYSGRIAISFSCS